MYDCFNRVFFRVVTSGAGIMPENIEGVKELSIIPEF